MNNSQFPSIEPRPSVVQLNIPNNKEYAIYEYPYMLSFQDRIFYSIGDAELRKELFEKINFSFEKDYSHSLAGEIALENLLTNEDLAGKIKKLLIDKINLHSSIPVKDAYIKSPDGNNDIWLNRMKANEYNPAHYHGGLISWIWYINIPESIRNESTQNKSSRGLVEFKSSRSNELMKFNPSTNDFFMFSSNHMHTVYPFRTDEIRISLAGNIQGLLYENGRIEGFFA